MNDTGSNGNGSTGKENGNGESPIIIVSLKYHPATASLSRACIRERREVRASVLEFIRIPKVCANTHASSKLLYIIVIFESADLTPGMLSSRSVQTLRALPKAAHRGPDTK